MTEKTVSFKQFIFGDTVVSHRPFTPPEAEKLISRGRTLIDKGKLPTQDQVIAIFFHLSKAWADPNYKKRQEAVEALSKNSTLGTDLVKAVFTEFAKIISPEYLRQKLEGELGRADIQGRLNVRKERKSGLIAQPAGQVLHVASGNVFVACIDSLVNGILTRNVNYLKMSTDDRDFPVLFAESIREFDREGAIYPGLCILWWPGGSEGIENVFKKNMDRIVFWGGGEALKNWERELGESTILIRHGPKISFGVVSKAGLEAAQLPTLTYNIGADITIWDQKACNCPQMLFLEESITDEQVKQFIDSLAGSLDKLRMIFPTGNRQDDEYVEVLKVRELATAKGLVTGWPVSVIGPKTFDWTIIFEEKTRTREVEISPLNRTIIIKRYSSLDELSELFKGYSFYLQTAGYCLGKAELPEYAEKLSAKGVTRLCPFGIMSIPAPGTPHDGGFALRELTRLTVVES